VTLRFAGFDVVDPNPDRILLLCNDVRSTAAPNADHVAVLSGDVAP